MIRNRMSCRHNLSDNLRMLAHIIPDHEEGRPGPKFVEDRQELWRKFGLRSIVESQSSYRVAGLNRHYRSYLLPDYLA
jgi:hypothetical protein